MKLLSIVLFAGLVALCSCWPHRSSGTADHPGRVEARWARQPERHAGAAENHWQNENGRGYEDYVQGRGYEDYVQGRGYEDYVQGRGHEDYVQG
ncbi:uncharacterized protein [Dermacentor andersoni]|uniref:uncharacterized protein isoform X3 n=1 Tax=Dermacentor andersoni TaxID=34620 RepID=UPI003B3BDB0B